MSLLPGVLLTSRTVAATLGSANSTPLLRMGSSLRSSLRCLSAGPSPAEEAPLRKAVHLPTNKESPRLLALRHTAAHIMAMAVQSLYPTCQVTTGPWTDTGCFYDLHFTDGRTLSSEDFAGIKKAMDKIIKQNLPIRREVVSREEARRRIREINEPFKLEILDGIKSDGSEEEPITIYKMGDEPGAWWDLCAGPHVESTGAVDRKAFMLSSVAGAYWKADDTREQLVRLYATVWETPEQLKEYKYKVAEALKRDHRTLGAALNLFTIQQQVGGGLILWTPKGSKVRTTMEDYWRDEHKRSGYEIVYTPHVADVDLWRQSGHLDFYKEGMFKALECEGKDYQLKPMNCPFHCMLFKDSPKSYRDLPIRWGELGTVYRYEQSGSLHGLMRVRGFTQDDAHVYCLPEQLEDEIVAVLDLTENILTKFGFADYEINLSTRPEKSVGSDAIWDAATRALVSALDRKGWNYVVDEGGGAFYGPKIDLKIKDCLDRKWQCSTIQCDFNLPERFDLNYKDKDGTMKRPIMVHRAIFGSVERFFGILIENCAGEFPLWLAPVQLKLLTVTDSALEYCHQVRNEAVKRGIRIEVDSGSERLPKQVRNAEKMKIPLMAIVGMKEVENGELSIRSKKLGDLGSFSVNALLSGLEDAISRGKEFEQLGKQGEK